MLRALLGCRGDIFRLGALDTDLQQPQAVHIFHHKLQVTEAHSLA